MKGVKARFGAGAFIQENLAKKSEKAGRRGFFARPLRPAASEPVSEVAREVALLAAYDAAQHHRAAARLASGQDRQCRDPEGLLG